MKTMHEIYGDGTDHECCETCGFCKTCRDCTCDNAARVSVHIDSWLETQQAKKVLDEVESVLEAWKNQNEAELAILAKDYEGWHKTKGRLLAITGLQMVIYNTKKELEVEGDES